MLLGNSVGKICARRLLQLSGPAKEARSLGKKPEGRL